MFVHWRYVCWPVADEWINATRVSGSLCFVITSVKPSLVYLSGAEVRVGRRSDRGKGGLVSEGQEPPAAWYTRSIANFQNSWRFSAYFCRGSIGFSCITDFLPDTNTMQVYVSWYSQWGCIVTYITTDTQACSNRYIKWLTINLLVVFHGGYSSWCTESKNQPEKEVATFCRNDISRCLVLCPPWCVCTCRLSLTNTPLQVANCLMLQLTGGMLVQVKKWHSPSQSHTHCCLYGEPSLDSSVFTWGSVCIWYN